MDPELVEEINRVDRQHDLERKADDKQRNIEDPAEQEPRARLPQRRRQVVVFTLVVHRMRGPQDRYLVAEAMEPVVQEIPRNGGQRP